MGRRVDCRIWLMDGDRPLLDENRSKLLALIKEKGSIVEGGKAVGISFRHAWAMVHKIEEDAGFKVVTSMRGGTGRGSSRLTPEGEGLLQEYENKKRRVEEQVKHLFQNPTLTTDGIVLVNDKITLIRRRSEPGKGKFALPGGFVEYGEKVEECVVREVWEETGLETEVLDLVGVYSDPGRDPRGHIVTAVFFLRTVGGELRAGDDASDIGLFDLSDLPELAFDHRAIIADFLRSHPGHGRKARLV